jgi:hypothetical protein
MSQLLLPDTKPFFEIPVAVATSYEIRGIFIMVHNIYGAWHGPWCIALCICTSKMLELITLNTTEGYRFRATYT